VICPQCGEPIDTTGEYDLGGRLGYLDCITRPSHLGACETMVRFVLVPRCFTIKAPAKVIRVRAARVRSKAIAA
jgi:hypothetical protein